MKSKKPILALAVVFFWIGYSVLSITFYTLSINSLSENHTFNKKNNIDYHLETSMDFLINDSIDSLVDRLESARKLDHFNFFLIRKNGNNLVYGVNQSNLEGIDISFPEKDKWVEDLAKTHIWKTKKINGYEITLGAVTANAEYLFTKLDQKKYFLLSELAFVTLFSFGIIAFLFRDILKITKRLRSKETNLEGLTTLSSEAESILNATKTMHETGTELRNTNQTYSQVITPAILEEIRLQTPTPSSFPMTLVRVDLNGYTQIFLERREKYIAEILNLYFERAREVIERYNGLIYQYVGDEIIFYIKDTPSAIGSAQKKDSILKAIFCVRYLFDVAQEIEDKFARAQGHEFKIKCSMAHGQLFFVQLDQGYGFSGLPLIESVRMLGSFSDKKENTLCFYDDIAKVHDKFYQIDETRDALFKGFSQKSDVALITKFAKLNDLLGKTSATELISVYKSDSDILFWLDHLKMAIEQNKKDYFFKIFAELKEVKYSSVNEHVIRNYTHMLRWILTEFQKNSEMKTFLSALVSLAYNLIPAKAFNTELYNIFEQILRVDDPRTKANALTTLSEFDPSSELYKDYLANDSNRLAGNALLLAAKKDFNAKIYDHILNFIYSENPYFIATGLFVTEQIFKFYSETNAVFFKSYPLFSDLLKACGEFLNHESPMIKARAAKIPGINESRQEKLAV